MNADDLAAACGMTPAEWAALRRRGGVARLWTLLKTAAEAWNNGDQDDSFLETYCETMSLIATEIVTPVVREAKKPKADQKAALQDAYEAGRKAGIAEGRESVARAIGENPRPIDDPALRGQPLTQEQRDLLHQLITDNPTMGNFQIAMEFRRLTGRSVSPATVTHHQWKLEKERLRDGTA